MQLYAIDVHAPILAVHAIKGKSYSCSECQSRLRLRGGPHRQMHFYHIKKNSACSQHKKSLTHLQIQWIVSSLLPKGESFLERPYPQIGRIADVAWEAGKTIFEIQCSPITLEEVQKRCRDYESLGFTVVWILHDKRFNRRKLSGAENFLRQRLCFFTNIDKEGKGLIYDQHEVRQGHRRLHKGFPIRVDLRKPVMLPKKRSL